MSQQELATVPDRLHYQCLSASQSPGPPPHSARAFTSAGEIPASQSSCDIPCEKKLTSNIIKWLLLCYMVVLP